jgi:replicative DNA helicase
MTREPPHNFEAEQAVLGSILVNNASYSGVAEFLKPEHFADPLHGHLYQALVALLERGQMVNAITLKTYAEQNEDLKKIGGPKYLASLMAASVHALDVVTMGRLVQDLAVRRQLIEVANGALSAAHGQDPADTAAAQIERIERDLYQLAETGVDNGFRDFNAVLTDALKTAEAAHHRSGQLSGVPTGLTELDELLGGLHQSDLIILASRPAMGKTALATNIGFNAAKAYRAGDQDGRRHTVDGASVCFFSLEMSAKQLVTRILAEQAGVPSERVRRGQLTGPQMDRLITVTGGLEGLPLHIDDTPALTISALRTRARRLKRQKGLDLIVVDYLQLVDASNRKDGRVQEVSEITRGLKTLAKELDVPVLALSQLSRKVEDRADKRPQLSDLRDSGSIEQDADVVMFIYREEYYLQQGSPADRARLGDVAGQTEVHIAKQRHGPTGTVNLQFDGPTTRFSDAPSEHNALEEAA